MSGQIRAVADQQPGYARLTIGGTAGITNPRLRIRRDGWAQDILGPQGWQIGDALLPAMAVDASGGDLVLTLGPGVTQHLESATYYIALPEAGIGEQPVFWPDIVPVVASRRRRVLVGEAAPQARVAPAVPPEFAAGQRGPADGSVLRAPRPEPAPQPPRPEPAEASKSRLWLVVAGAAVLAVLIAGGVAAFLYHRAPSRPATPAPAAASAPQTPPAAPSQAAKTPSPAVPPSLGSLSVNQVLAQAPNVRAIFDEGEHRLQGKQKDEGLLLIEAAADKGSPAAMLALARLYDPVGFSGQGPIPRADMREAAEYFRKAVQAGSADAAAPRAALQTYLRNAAQNGDLDAKLTLQDFWP